jgi:hypothetical protein
MSTLIHPVIMTDAIRPCRAAAVAAVCFLAACGTPQHAQAPPDARATAATTTGDVAPAPAPTAPANAGSSPEPTPAPAGRLAAPHGETARAVSPETTVARPAYREVTIPAGTLLPIVLDTAVASDTSSVEDQVRAHLRRAVPVAGAEALPAGTALDGVVVAAERPGKVKGRARVACRLTSLRLDDERVDVRTSIVSRRAPATKKQDAAKIGIPAAGGAVVGAIIGGKKGAAIGGAAGGGAGTAVVLSTRGKEIRLPAGSTFSVRLLEPVTVRVRVA